MTTAVRDIFRRHAQPRTPRATGWQPILAPLSGIKAVLFDVYGTLFVSGARSIGSGLRPPSAPAFRAALAAVGLTSAAPSDGDSRRLNEVVERMHVEARGRGDVQPEVDILEAWRRTLGVLMDDGVLPRTELSPPQLRRLAAEFESRTNPVWPMPGVRRCWRALRAQGARIGLISNAQFYTRELFPALLGASAEELGVVPQWQFYSYLHGAAKPGTPLFLAARDVLRQHQIRPHETLCVGNDMQNDVIPAATVGFRTALFAGDGRSLRWAHSRLWDGTAPDLILTELVQLPPCVAAEPHARRSPWAWYRAWWDSRTDTLRARE